MGVEGWLVPTVMPEVDRSGSGCPHMRQIWDIFRIKAIQNVLKLHLKSPGFVPLWVNLTEFGVEFDIPSIYLSK